VPYAPTLFFTLLLSLTLSLEVWADPIRSNHVEAELVSATDSLVPGQSTWLAIRLKADDEWHTYWENPGDTGLPTSVDWVLPTGVSVSSLHWPFPSRHNDGGLISYVYDGEVFLLARLQTPADFSAEQATLKAEVSWLACKQACVPGSATLELTLPVAESSRPTKWKPEIELFQDRLPGELPGRAQVNSVSEQKMLLQVVEGPLQSDPREAYFFPVEELVLESSAPQALLKGDQAWSLELMRSSVNPQKPDRLRGILLLTTATTRQAFSLDLPIEPQED